MTAAQLEELPMCISDYAARQDVQRLIEERKRLLDALKEIREDGRLPEVSDWDDAIAFADEEAP